IGTAGGARMDQALGDVVITNAALLKLQRPQNTSYSGNGNMYCCPTWYPAATIIQDVERSLLYRMDKIVTTESLQNLFLQLKTKHANDSNVAQLKLTDLINDSIRPEQLGSPKVQLLKDVPLLTTDFYYISAGHSADAYAFLELDDGIVVRESNRLGVRFASVRNISDPVVPHSTNACVAISEAV